MKAAPNKQPLGKNLNDRAPRVVDAGKGQAGGKPATQSTTREFGSKQPTSTGRAKKPQYL